MKQFFFALLAIAALTMFSQTSCFYDNEVDQYGTGQCDTVAMSYSKDIKPIVDANCLSCHSPGGEQEGSPFDTYDGFASYALDGKIVERLHGVTANIMPPSGPISSCDQLKIESWVNAGALNN